MVDENWHEKGQVVSHLDTFCLDATVFEHNNHLYYVWAQKDNAIEGNSNLYIAEMTNPWTLKTEPVMLTKPEFAWECKGFKVNEGPAVLMRNGKIFITYSASATDENYCMGMIYADLESDLLKRENWTKVTEPVFQSDLSTQQYGPGHNSFYYCRRWRNRYPGLSLSGLYGNQRGSAIRPEQTHKSTSFWLGVTMVSQFLASRFHI